MKRTPVLLALGFATLAAPLAEGAEISVRAPRLNLPPISNASYLAGLRYDLRGDHRAAAEAYQAAVSAHVPRAAFQLKMSKEIAEKRETVRRSPDDYEHHFNLGVNLQNKYWAIYLDLGVRSEMHIRLAEHHFKEALRLQPMQANPLICLAALYAQGGDRARGKETIKGLAQRETRPTDLYNLAFYYKVVGDMNEAYRLLRQALQFDARHREWVLESDDFVEYLDDPKMKELLQERGGQLGLQRHSRRLRIFGLGGGGSGIGIGKIIPRLRQYRLRPITPTPPPSGQPGGWGALRVHPVPQPVQP
jgi:tetratricopeptide (TPR) repeat protein